MFTGIYSSEDHLEREFETGSTVCDLSVNKIFSVLAGLISFWIPAVVIVYVYARSGHLIFFCLLFVKKSLIDLEGKSMTPRRGNTILFLSSQQLPRLRLEPLKGFLS